MSLLLLASFSFLKITLLPAITGVPAVVGIPVVACVSTVAVSIVHAVAGVPAIELYNKSNIQHHQPTDFIFNYRAIEYRTGDSKTIGLLDTGLRPQFIELQILDSHKTSAAQLWVGVPLAQ